MIPLLQTKKNEIKSKFWEDMLYFSLALLVWNQVITVTYPNSPEVLAILDQVVSLIL